MVASSILIPLAFFLFNAIHSCALSPTLVSRQTQLNCVTQCSTIIQISQQCGNSDQCICTPNNLQAIAAELPSCESCIQSLPPSSGGDSSDDDPATAAALESNRAQSASSAISSIGRRQLSSSSLPSLQGEQILIKLHSSSLGPTSIPAPAPVPTAVATSGQATVSSQLGGAFGQSSAPTQVPSVVASSASSASSSPPLAKSGSSGLSSNSAQSQGGERPLLASLLVVSVAAFSCLWH
ncbi:hypothetical protein BDQ17DRAFT_1431347 [Cyathus striatus]|nr:hypothetical protein BDQ17DRAFT_1431347 [Cyathus striatus]